MPDTRDLTAVIDDTGYPIGLRTMHRPPQFVCTPMLLVADFNDTAPVTGTTSETALSTQLLVPGGLMGMRGAFRLSMWFGANNNANAKTVQLKLNGVNFGAAVNLASTAGMCVQRVVGNRGSQATNRWYGTANNPGSTGDSAPYNATFDTSLNQVLTANVTLANAGDQVWLAGYMLEVFASE